MRLQRLQLRRYGCFDDVDLRLATEPGRITMIVAPNGAGKSVLRRAIHDLLFDIPVQSPMKFRHGYPGMALHAEAIDADGTAFGFGWVRGAKPARVTTDPARFAALQRGVTPRQLEELFALDTMRLRKGGTDLKGGATLAGALLAGTGELASAKSVRANIEARRQANWGQSKSKPPLNAAASRLEAERKSAGAAVQRPERREKEERDVEDAQRRYETAKQALDDALAEARRLNRIALVRQPLRQLEDAEEWLAGNADAPALPTGLDQSLAEARAAIVTAQAIHDGAQRALAVASTAADGIARDPAATSFAESVGKLPGMLGEAEKTAKDIVERRAERVAKLEEVGSALRDIGVVSSATQVADVIPDVGVVAEARAAITREAGLRKAVELAASGLERATSAHASAATEPAAAEPLPEGLIALLDEIRSDRNPAQHAAETAELARVAAAEVARSLAVFPGWTGTAEALRALILPSEASFERVDEARRSANVRHAEARKQLAGLSGQDTEARTGLSALREQLLPDAAGIAAARAERDRGMRLVLRHAFIAKPAPADDAAYAGDEPVALVYERHVRSADELADRRTAELERVQEAERLGRLIDDLAGPLQDARTEEAKAAAGLAAAERAWSCAVMPLGLDPSSAVAELRQALASRLLLIEAMMKAEIALGGETALRAVHHGWAARLAALLDLAPEPLGVLLGRADQRVAMFRAAQDASAQQRARLDAAERGLRDATDARDKAGRALEEWREGWARLLLRLHRPADESPEAVMAVLNGIVSLDQHHRDAVSLERRIDAMQADLDGFATNVAELARVLGEPKAATPADAARALTARAAQASRAESAWRQAQLGLEQARRTAAEGEAGLAAANTRLASVIAACGAATGAEAEQRIAASRAQAEQMARRDAARLMLDQYGDGRGTAALRLEADGIAPDDMSARRDETEASVQAARVAAEGAAVNLDQLTTALHAEVGATAAVDARANYEAAAAEFGRRLEEQLVLHLASSMLGDAMRSVEEDMGGSSLARLSQTFAAVTGDAYGLETRHEAEGEELYAVEHAYPQERKSLDELSEGTRDQLYLALRMVALRDHCASATALPFVADDILQTFDDTRATATLRALGDLSNELQVIVLTHHAHLGRVAAELGEARVHLLTLT